MLRDTWTIFKFQLMLSVRDFVWLFLGLAQPLAYLLIFAPLLEKLTGVQGVPYDGAFNVFTPGLLVLMALFSASYVGFSLIFSLQEGVVERMRVTPVNRVSMVLGMVLKDALILLVQSCLLLGASTFLGLDPDPLGLLLTLGLIMLVGIIMASTSYALALLFKEPGGLAATTNFFLQPLMLLSGILLPMTLAPRILQTVADVNPLTHVVEASRALINGNLSDGSVPLSFGLCMVLAMLTLWWAVRSMREAMA